jgi:molybdate/tungstate transport system substrate-binding protein
VRTAYIILAIVALAAVASFIFYQYNQVTPQQTSVLKIYCADSLLYPMQRAEEAFELENPTIDVQVEGHGSIQVIRHVTELGDVVDLMTVADYSLIPTMMYNMTMPNSTEPYSDWYVRFAGNELVLAYTAQSNHAYEVNSTNWHEILATDGTSFGLPNPEIDALGYRALIAIKLAEGYYGEPQLFYQLISQNFNPQLTAYSIGGGKSVILIPETQTPVGGKVYLRASGVMLVPLLESGTIDYCFLYKSMAEQQNFSYVELPPEINMGDISQEAYYSQVTVEYQHQRFATVNLNRTGSTTYYGLTIPANAPNPALAERFIEFMINGTGRAIFEASHFPIFGTCYTDNLQALPEALTAFIQAEP